MASEVQILEALERRLSLTERNWSELASPSFAEFAPIFDQLPLYRTKVAHIKLKYRACLSRREELLDRLARLREGLGDSTAGMVLRPPQQLRFKVVYPGGVRIRSGPSFEDEPLSDVEGGRVVSSEEVLDVIERVLVNGQRDVFVKLREGGFLPETKGDIIVLRRMYTEDQSDFV